MLENFQTGVIDLIKSAVTGTVVKLPEDFDYSEAISLGKKHQIIPLLYYGVSVSGLSLSKEFQEELFSKVCKYIFISEQQNFEYLKVINAFEENEIEYMPLKGIILKNMFPKPEMRPMGDVDILIKMSQVEKITQIMQELGFTQHVESDHELVWKKNSLLFELHKRMIPSYNRDYYAYYGDGWRLAKKEAGFKNRYKLSDEDQLIYLFTHFSKHYRDGGIGIKHLVDLWIFITHTENLDQQYIKTELEKLQLFSFYQNIMRLINVWFNEAESDEMTDFMTNVIFSSGAYGTKEGHVVSSMVKLSKSTNNVQAARTKKTLELLFLPYNYMCEKYPVLKKAPFLLPFLWIARWIQALLFRRENIKYNAESLNIANVENVSNYQKSLNYVGLDFNFKE